jgi:SAM-dependent methyltransferase
MNPNGDVYYGMVANAYDWYLGDPEGDEVEFFASLVGDGSGPGLELGCGTGRVLVELAARGLEVDGVDSSQDMLDICRTKAHERGVEVGLFEQYAQRLRLPRRYASVYCPSSTFRLFVDPADADSALQGMYEHLCPGGRIALALSVPQSDDRCDEWRIRCEVERNDVGVTLRLWERVSIDPETQTQTNELRNHGVADGEIIAGEEHVTLLRWWTPDQFTALLLGAGFERVVTLDGFGDQPATSASPAYVAVARTPRP